MDLPYPKGEEFDPGGLEQLGCRSRVAAVRVAVRYQENGFRRCWPTELSGEREAWMIYYALRALLVTFC